MSAASISTAQLRDFANAFRASFGAQPMRNPEEYNNGSTTVEQPTEEVPAAPVAETPAPSANEHSFQKPYSHDEVMADAETKLDVVTGYADTQAPVRGTLIKSVAYVAFSMTWLKSAIKAAYYWTKDKIRQAYSYVVNARPVRFVTDKIRAAYDWIRGQIAAGHAKMKEYRWYAYICEKLNNGYAYVSTTVVSSFQWTRAKVSAALSWVWAKLCAGIALVRSGLVSAGNWLIDGADSVLATVRGWFGTTKAVVTAAVAAGATAAAMATAPVQAPTAPTAAPAAAEQVAQDTEEQKCNAHFYKCASQPNVREVKFDAGWGNESNGFAGLITGDSAIRVVLNAEQQLADNEMRVGETLRTTLPNNFCMLIVGTRLGPVAVFDNVQAGEQFYAITATEDLGNCGALNMSGKITLQDLQAILGKPGANDASAANIGERMEEILGKMVQATPGR